MLPGMTRRRWLWVLGFASAALLLVLALLDLRMQDTGGPGIIAFELAGSNAQATEIMAEWGAAGQDAARLSLWLDFPYLVLYGAFLPAVAALCDVAEDVGLLLILDGRGGTRLPQIATAFALVKFAALAAVAAYLLTGLAGLARRHLRWVR